jgi:SNF2 family DNA or RNA helicase
MNKESFVFKTQPYQHQLDALIAGANKKSFAYLMDMGTGKSKVLLDNAYFLWKNKIIDALVILAPKSVYRNWAAREIPAHYPGQYAIYCWRGTTTLKEEEERVKLFEDKEDHIKIFCMNIDAVITERGQRLLKMFLLSKKAMLAVDESSRIKTHDARRTKAITVLGQYAICRRILTGTPVTNSPLDLFGQCQFLDSKLLGFSSYYAFRRRYAIMKKVVLRPIYDEHGNVVKKREFEMVVGYQRLDELQDRLRKFSFRVTKDEALDLPPKIYQLREVEMSPDQSRAYQDMKKRAVFALDQNMSSASIALVQLGKLHQIAQGHVKMDDGQQVIFDGKKTKVEETLDILQECSGKVIIWANYIHDLQSLHAAITKDFGPDSAGLFYGATSSEDRERIINRFQDPQDPLRFFIANQDTGGIGITLTAATTVIYYSNTFKYEDRKQSEDRAHRSGQTKSVTYIDLVTKGTVDEKVLDALKNKINIASTITGDELKAWVI